MSRTRPVGAGDLVGLHPVAAAYWTEVALYARDSGTALRADPKVVQAPGCWRWAALICAQTWGATRLLAVEEPYNVYVRVCVRVCAFGA